MWIVESIAFHVYAGELASGVVVAILSSLQLCALDSATGEIFNEAEVADRLMKWQKFRDKVRLETRATPARTTFLGRPHFRANRVNAQNSEMPLQVAEDRRLGSFP